MEQTGEKKILGVSRNVFFLGWVSFLTDVSSDMIFTVMPLFLSNVLKVSIPIIGLIEGIAEGTASLLKLVSGWLSDRLGKRKSLAVFGYSLSALAKPFLYIASSWGTVLAIRWTDRVGKGIRSAPRDALVADCTVANERGRSFGFHRGMDTLGAVVGLALAALIVYLVQEGGLELTRGAFRTLVLAGIGPAVLSVLILLFFVRERKKTVSPRACDAAPVQTECKGTAKVLTDGRFKIFLVIIVLFTLGNSSDAFLILRAQNLGFSVSQTLLLFVAFNLVYALAALPAGMISDRLGRRKVIIVGWSIYALSYLGFALATDAWHVWLLFALYGLYYGVAEGVCRAFVCDIVPAEKRGTAYGWYHTAVGLSLLPASVIAGWLWHLIGPAAPFYFGAALAGTAMLGLALLIRE
ncbi:MAG: MFS transporter [Chloroflexi bacterium]|nr:MFS transporter [Chloroflexota bacterium]